MKNYIEKNILPIYEKNDSGHGIEHIRYVTERCMKFASQFENINPDMLFAIAAFHDIAHHIDKKNHETLSAKIFYENEDQAYCAFCCYFNDAFGVCVLHCGR